MMATGTSAYAAASGTLFATPDVLVDHVPDELRVADERRRDVVAEREREREDRAGHDPGEGERPHHAAERDPASGPQVARGLQVGARDPLERRVDRAAS